METVPPCSAPMLAVASHPSPLGTLVLSARDGALVGLHLPGSSDPAPEESDTAPVLDEARRQLDAYFAGERTAFELPLALAGTAFQQAVWNALRKIPYGETCRYGALAAAVGNPAASRAVGMANHRNPIAIIVPCHRVNGASGKLTGFGGGLPAKRYLLGLEQRHSVQPLGLR